MALESPLIHSPEGPKSAFSPYTDSPASPGLSKSPLFPRMSHEPRDKLHAASPNSRSSLGDVAGPSPATSNGTDNTEIDDSPAVDNEAFHKAQDSDRIQSGISGPIIRTIDTSIPTAPGPDSDDAPQSAIHAPQKFPSFDGDISPIPLQRSTPSPSPESDRTVKSPMDKGLKVVQKADDPSQSTSPQSPPPISTAVGQANYTLDTPRAQTRQELEGDRVWHRTSGNLEDIPEGQDGEHNQGEEYTEEEEWSQDKPATNQEERDDEIRALKSALAECWTLCNTLANLSSIHRARIFTFAGKGAIEEQAWKSCWKLCQKLYDSRDEAQDSEVRPTLDLCREFCQALFEIRRREDEITDSVLRVSFELNNHLYNTHDRNLPEAFRERTLDFYITLCHRLMKQRIGLASETDALLRACWSLAEMLFSLRQTLREGKQADEELVGSAIQACWELCDLFREGWTQIRPDRTTPRPSQTTFTFTQAFNHAKQSSNLPSVVESNVPGVEPETPTTIFKDTIISPDVGSPTPNILVLGHDYARNPHWSSASSTISGYSHSSAATSSSTATTTAAQPEDPNLTRLKLLILRAAMNAGYQRTQASLPSFVQKLPPTSFGTQPWQMTLLENYKQMVLADSTFRNGTLPTRSATAKEIAIAVKWMVGKSQGQFSWLIDLFKLVFGFSADEIQT